MSFFGFDKITKNRKIIQHGWGVALFCPQMAKEVLLYGDIYSQRARDFIKEVDAASGEDLSVRVNSYGGDVDYGWGMVSKFVEHKGKKSVKIDAAAHSMAAYFAIYADEVEATDVASMIFHRAAYPTWVESDSQLFTDARKQELTRVNGKLREAMESKISSEDWEKVTGVSYDRMFDEGQAQIDVPITAKEAKKLGIVQSITTITPKQKAAIEARLVAMAEGVTGLRLAAINEPKTNSNPKAMTIETLKAEHPDVYAAAVKAGISQERDRVGAWVVFADVDVKAVTEGIKSGEGITATATAEFSRKAFAASQVSALEDGSAKAVATTEPKADAHAANVNPELAALEAQVDKFLNIK
jgi:ATP-dependent protease ClpP protease subunit